MSLFVSIALILAIVVAVWAVMERTWQLLLVAAAVILLALALTGSLNLSLHD